MQSQNCHSQSVCIMTESLKRCGSKILHFRVNIFFLYLVAAVKVFDSIFGSTQQQFVMFSLVSRQRLSCTRWILSQPSLQLQSRHVAALSQTTILATLTPQDGSEALVSLTCTFEEAREPAEKPGRRRGKMQNATRKSPWELNLQPSCCEATALITAPPSFHLLIQKLRKDGNALHMCAVFRETATQWIQRDLTQCDVETKAGRILRRRSHA